MATRLVNVVIDVAPDAGGPRALSRYWADLLDWRVSLATGDEVDVQAPPEDGWDLDLVFVPVSDLKTVKNRIHLDLASASPDEQAAIVHRALELGGTRADIGQHNVPWVVIADPAGNEFCALEPRPEYATTGAVAAIAVDSADPGALAEFWSAATGWPVVRTEPRDGDPGDPGDPGGPEVGFASLRPPGGRGPWLEFLYSSDPKRVKNRVHLDVAPFAGDDHATEVARLIECGARPADVGQRGVPWVVLQDPEGGEFCVLTPR